MFSVDIFFSLFKIFILKFLVDRFLGDRFT